MMPDELKSSLSVPEINMVLLCALCGTLGIPESTILLITKQYLLERARREGEDN